MLPFKPLEKIQELLNAVLRQDERAITAVSELAGKLIAIQVTGATHTIFVKFEKEQVSLSLVHDAKPNVTIKAHPFSLPGLLLDRDGKATGITPDLNISGDTQLAQQFQQILRNLQIDWEEHLSHWIGDIAAHQLGRLCRTTRSYLRETRQTIGINISEYLRYEKDILPTGDQVAEFVSSVDVLRNDVERLQKQFERLQRKIT